MSLNLVIGVERCVSTPAGNPDVDRHTLDVWQTSTETTEKILNSPNPLQEYFDWCTSYNEDMALFHIQELKYEIESYISKEYELFFTLE
jgi:hypothetical protein